MVVYTCNKCKKTFTMKVGFDRHKARKYPCGNGSIGRDYKCDICDKVFTSKASYDRHKTRKTPCKLMKDLNEYKCDNCNKVFNYKYSLTRHLVESCKIENKPPNNIQQKQTNITNNKPAFIQMPEGIKEQNIIVNGNIINGDVVNNTFINNIINNNDNKNLTFNIVPFGKEIGIDAISEAKYREIVYRGYSSICKMIDQIHFNEDIPENHNVCIKNLRTNYANTFDGETWELRDKEEVIDQLISTKYELLEEMYDKLTSGKKKRINETRAIGFVRLKEDYDNNEKTMKRLRDDVELQLYNRRHITLKTKKKHDEQLKLLK